MSLYDGLDVALVATGSVLELALEARLALEGAGHGLSVSVSSIPYLKPWDTTYIQALGRKVRLIVTIEEHTTVGGLGGAVAETLSEMPGQKAQLARIGVDDRFSSVVGSQEFLRKKNGISTENIIKTVVTLLKTGRIYRAA